jgi:serine/threonine-protein kinase
MGAMLCCAYYFAGDMDRAHAQIRSTSELHPGFPIVDATLGWVLSQMGDHEGAIAACRSAHQCTPESGLFQLQLAQVLALAGQNDEARALLKRVVESRRTEWVSSYYIGLVHTALGERDKAFEWLEEAIRERDGWRVLGGVDPRLQVLAADPRFERWLRKMCRNASSAS